MGDENETTTTASSTTTANTPEAMSWVQAYDQTKEEADSVPEDDLYTVNIDVEGAILTAMGIWPRIEAFLPTVEKHLSGPSNIARIKSIPRYTSALMHAQRLYAIAHEPVAPIKEWSDELSPIHDRLVSDAEALSKHGLMDVQKLPVLKNHSGYRALAFNVSNLVQLFRANWTKIAGRTPFTDPALQDIEDKARKLVAAIAEQDYRTAQQTVVQAIRRRYFTLFAQAYGEARRAAIFLRWFEGDADQIVPSLWEGRGGSKKKDEKPSKGDKPTAQQQPAAPAGAAPVVDTSGPPMPATNGANGTAAPPAKDPFGRPNPA